MQAGRDGACGQQTREQASMRQQAASDAGEQSDGARREHHSTLSRIRAGRARLSTGRALTRTARPPVKR
ncbi:hypothetical protein JCM18899A_08500 [Nocardioides sp. AN3]